MKDLKGKAGFLIAAMHPAYFALIMSTGIISIACHLVGFSFLAIILLWLNLALYLILWLLTVGRLVFYPRQIFHDFSSHNRGVGFFTMIAGTCILGNQFLILIEAYKAAMALWLLGIFLWAFLIYGVCAALIAKLDKPPLAEGINGTWLVSAVGTQSIAILSSQLASQFPRHREELLFFSLCIFLLGGMLYVTIIVMISYRFFFFELDPQAFEPPYWINAGAVAISTLAGAFILINSSGVVVIESLRSFILGSTILFWSVATWWIPLLVILEIWRNVIKKVALSYDPSYWGLVFPLGMYTACTIQLSKITQMDFLLKISDFFIYIALAAWTLTFFGMLRGLIRSLVSDAMVTETTVK